MTQRTQSRGAAVGAALLAIAAAGAAAVLWVGPRAATSGSDTGASAVGANAAEAQHLELVTATGVHALDVEVAATPERQALGLMYRTSLPETKGMLFPTSGQREVSMWMRNTYIPLDMVFIRPDGTVHRIEARTEPLSERIISSDGPVAAVLEIAGGAAERMGLRPGDKVRHALFGAEPPK